MMLRLLKNPPTMRGFELFYGVAGLVMALVCWSTDELFITALFATIVLVAALKFVTIPSEDGAPPDWGNWLQVAGGLILLLAFILVWRLS